MAAPRRTRLRDPPRTIRQRQRVPECHARIAGSPAWPRSPTPVASSARTPARISTRPGGNLTPVWDVALTGGYSAGDDCRRSRLTASWVTAGGRVSPGDVVNGGAPLRSTSSSSPPSRRLPRRQRQAGGLYRASLGSEGSHVVDAGDRAISQCRVGSEAVTFASPFLPLRLPLRHGAVHHSRRRADARPERDRRLCRERLIS